MTALPAHSPLGASGSHRWIACPGSVSLSEGIADDESDHAALGTAAHALGAYCLARGEDAWQSIGIHVVDGRVFYPEPSWKPEIGGHLVDKPMADAVQVYLDAIRQWHPERHQGNSWIERRFHCPTIHKYFFGTTDFTYLDDTAPQRLHVWDYKHGAGVVVEVERNPQLMYYAAGMLEDLGLWESVEVVVLHVCQPRGFHPAGRVRHWKISVPDLVAWLEDELVPAMDRALVSRDTASGEHCRFCPARGRACPQILKDIDELEALMAIGAKDLTHEQVARILNLGEVFKIARKAAEETAFARLSNGHAIPGWKLAAKRANRAWKDGAHDALLAKFGGQAMTEPELKSPAQIDELPEGEALTARWAFKPDTGLTVVRGDDTRPAVSKDTKSLFQPVKKGRK